MNMESGFPSRECTGRWAWELWTSNGGWWIDGGAATDDDTGMETAGIGGGSGGGGRGIALDEDDDDEDVGRITLTSLLGDSGV